MVPTRQSRATEAARLYYRKDGAPYRLRLEVFEGGASLDWDR